MSSQGGHSLHGHDLFGHNREDESMVDLDRVPELQEAGSTISHGDDIGCPGITHGGTLKTVQQLLLQMAGKETDGLDGILQVRRIQILAYHRQVTEYLSEERTRYVGGDASRWE